jgi:hypothetical protein
MKLSRNRLRSLIKEELQMIRESANGMSYRARIMLGLVPGVEVLATNAVDEPWGSEDPEHKTLYFALQDLSDVVMSGYDNNSGTVMLRQEKLMGGERLPYLVDKLNTAKAIVMSGPKHYIGEQDVLIHFLTGIERVLIGSSGNS